MKCCREVDMSCPKVSCEQPKGGRIRFVLALTSLIRASVSGCRFFSLKRFGGFSLRLVNELNTLSLRSHYVLLW